MSAVLDRTSLYNNLSAAQAAKASAEQAISDAFTVLRLSGWGKIEKATWDHDYESDDQGGSYISINSAALVIDGTSYTIGYNFEDLLENGDEIEEGSHLETLVRKYELAGHEELEAFKHSLAELADLPYEEFEQFLGLVEGLVDQDKEAGELRFIP